MCPLRKVGQSVLSIVVVAGLTPLTLAAKLIIQQENVIYSTPLTQGVNVDTFVISSVGPKIQIDQRRVEKKGANQATDAHSTDPVVVLFEINSSTLSPGAHRGLLRELGRLGSPEEIALSVTGYTCPKGPAAYNQRLSISRAKSVAAAVSEKGYRATDVVGRGAEDLVSTGYLPSNRRVEIRVVDQ